MTPTQIEECIREEMEKAHRRYGLFTSSHEGFGVLMEEVCELQDAIGANDRMAVLSEAMQVAAVAWRIALACESEAFRKRSNL